MKQTVYLLTDESTFNHLDLMDEEEIQKGYVVATEGYMEKVFPKIGIIPKVYFYKESMPQVFKGSSVLGIKYDGSIKDAVDKIRELFHRDIVIHLRVLGSKYLKDLIGLPNFVDIVATWNDKNMGISLIYEGIKEVPDPIFPLWECRIKEEELKQVIPSFGKQILNFGAQLLKEAGSFLNNAEQVDTREYTRKWNTCLTCPKLVRDAKKDNKLCCGICGCPMKEKASWRSGSCGDKENPKF